MKRFLRNGMVVAGLALLCKAQANTIQYTFTETYALTASPTGELPQIGAVWQIPQFDGFGGLDSLFGVQYELRTQIFYRGVLVGIGTGANTPFNLLVRSDFNFDLPTSTPDVANLDPQILLNPTSDLAEIPFNAPGPVDQIAASLLATETSIAVDLATYVGSGTVPVTVSGTLLTSSPGGAYNNTSGLGPATPYVFVDNAKIFPMFGMQEFSLVATMIVTYSVPEAGTWAAVGALSLLVGARIIARRRSRRP